MKINFKIMRTILAICFISLSATMSFAATYYSNGSNAPNLTASWTTARDGSGTNPANFTAGDIFVIQNTHTMTTSATWSVSGASSRVWIESGGVLVSTSAITLAVATTFQIDNGGTYKHQNGTAFGSSIFQGTESFAANSTVELNTSNTTGPSPLGGFGNLIVNFTVDPGGSVNLSGTVTSIAGSLTIQSTSIREFRLTGNTTSTITIGGDLNVSAGTLNLSSGTGTPTINLGGNWNQTGGTITMSGGGAQTTLNFTGVGKTFSQSTNANTKINFNINSGASVTMNSDWTVATGRTLAVTGTLHASTFAVSGAGAFTLNSAANLSIGSANGITISAGSGNVQVSGTRTYNTGANYTYYGNVNQVAGDGLPSTVNNLIINNTATSGTVTLSANCTVSNLLTLTAGTLTTSTFALGYNSTTANLTRTSGAIDASSGTMSFGTNAAALSLPTGLFSAAINNLTINRAGGVSLAESITVNGLLSLASGLLTTSSSNMLTLGASASVSGGSTASHVSGPMRRTLNSAASFLFPFGTGGAYYPMTITATEATSAVVEGEAVAANAGGSGSTYINSLSTTEYWSAQLISGIYIGSVSIERPSALGVLSIIGRSLSLAGTYDNEGGTVIGSAINNSDSFVGNTSYFVMAEPTISCPKKTTITNSTAQSICTGSSATTLNTSVLNYVGSGTPTPQYQWYYNTIFSNTVAGATLISGATSSSYTPPTTSSEAGTRYYFCVAYATDNGCAQTDATQSLASEEVPVTVIVTPSADAPSDVTACDVHSLAGLSIGNYYSGSGGTGTSYLAGNNITSSMTMYVYAETGTSPNCTNENSFTITINTTPTPDSPSNVTACDSYNLPALTVGNYFTGSNGTGTPYSVGNTISSDISLYIYAETGTTPNCTNENAFMITLNTTPTADAPSNVTACDSYELPPLTVGNYFTGSGGTGTALSAGNFITSSQTIYVYAESGTTPNCTDENSFLVTINTTPTADAPADVTACDSYELPPLTVGNYFTGSGGTGTALSAGNFITSSQTIYVYAETGTTPNCTDENSFTVTINTTPTADAPANVTACDSYELPPLTVGNYFTGSGGTGTPLSAGNMITSTQTIYVYAETGTTPNCTDENSFVVTINTTPTADAPANVTACDSYELLPLTVGNYFTGSGGTGTPLSAGNSITSTQTIYVYAETGTTPNCTDENSFTVTINNTPSADAPSNVTACDSYELPPVTVGNYFTGSGGTGTALSAGDFITSSQTIYVYAETGTTPNCTDENSFTVTINNTPSADAPANVTACDSYELPPLTVGNYFTGSGGTGTALSAGNFITSSQTIYVYAETGTTPNCTDENSFTVTINNTPSADAPSNVTACDSYELPPLTVGNYFTGSGGTGTALSAGNFITSSQTIYVYAETGTTPNCTDENSFTVTINTTPTADAPSNVTACDSYELPPLTVGNYFTGSGGTGTALSAGNFITSTQTIYVYAETGTTPNCSDENSFVVTINTTPTADAPSNVTACDSYELPPLTVGNYFTGSGGTGTALSAGNMITSTQTIYVYAETGTTPNCTDENSFVVTVYDCSKLAGVSCGKTLATMDETLNSEAVAGATNYRYWVQHASGYSQVSTRGVADNLFRMSWLGNQPKYGTTYTVRVSAFVGGSWQPYGDVCNVTTPATKLTNSYCGIVLNSISDVVYSYPVQGATNYRYRVENTASGFLKVSTRGAANNEFSLGWFSSGVEIGRVYNVQVSAYVAGSWQPYGPVCTLTTPVPTTQLKAGSCNVNIPTLSTALYSNKVTGATNYRYEVVNVGAGFSKVSTRNAADTLFRLSWVSGIQLNTTYTIRVAAYVNNVWGAYSTACTVTTPAAIMADEEVVQEHSNGLSFGEELRLETYPNPNNGEFTITASHEGSFNIINELGQLIQTLEITKENAFQTQVEGLGAGVYFVTGVVNNEVLTKKVVVQ